MLFLGRLTAINHSYFEKLSSIVWVDASYVLVCFGPGRSGLGLECVEPDRASGLSTSGRTGPRAWIEDFGPVATSNIHLYTYETFENIIQ